MNYDQQNLPNYDQAVGILKNLLDTNLNMQIHEAGYIANLRYGSNNEFGTFELITSMESNVNVYFTKKAFGNCNFLSVRDLVDITGILGIYYDKRTQKQILQLKATKIRVLKPNLVYDRPNNLHPKDLPCWRDIRSIAVISGKKSDGYSDFYHAVNKPVRKKIYRRPVNLGPAGIEEVPAEIRKINNECSAQLICIVRGGGEGLDYLFNSEEVFDAIAASKIPVLTALGHQPNVFEADRASDYKSSYNHDSPNFRNPENLARFLNKHYYDSYNDMNDDKEVYQVKNDYNIWKSWQTYAVLIIILILLKLIF